MSARCTRPTPPWRCRRGEGLSVWVVPSSMITASDPADKEMLFEPTASKIYRHPTFYDVPDDVGHM
jgi:ring-1,2-phenylacetyl-CoA epoxidase subunit PaaB